jgi:hypothetical protein
MSVLGGSLCMGCSLLTANCSLIEVPLLLNHVDISERRQMLIKKVIGLTLLLIFSVGSLAFAGTPGQNNNRDRNDRNRMERRGNSNRGNWRWRNRRRHRRHRRGNRNM